MWWKVEISKAGKVANCTPVLAPAKKGNLLRFVEAETREEAIEAVKLWFKRYREQQRDYARRRTIKLREKRACTQCMGKSGAPPEEGKDRCRPCLDRKAKWREDFIERGRPPRPKADPLAARVRYDALHGLSLHATTVLKRFDELGPRFFREWLVAVIEDTKAKARGETTEAAE